MNIIIKYRDTIPGFEEQPEIKILKELLLALESDNLNIINVCVDLLIEKLVLFDPEILLLESIRSEEHESDLIEDKLSREEVGEMQKFAIIIDQKYSKLQQKMGALNWEIVQEKADFQKGLALYERTLKNLTK